MKQHHWYKEDGPLTEEAIKKLVAEADAQRGVLIQNERGVYVAPPGAVPGEGEKYFPSEA